MNESRMRYLCLILTGLEAFLVHLYMTAFLYGMQIPALAIEGHRPSPSLLIPLGIFTLLGLLLLFSVFFRPVYYFLTAGAAAFIGWFWAETGRIDGMILMIVAIAVFPFALYYVWRILHTTRPGIAGDESNTENP